MDVKCEFTSKHISVYKESGDTTTMNRIEILSMESSQIWFLPNCPALLYSIHFYMKKSRLFVFADFFVELNILFCVSCTLKKTVLMDHLQRCWMCSHCSWIPICCGCDIFAAMYKKTYMK